MKKFSKKWRTFSSEQKTRILTDYYGINFLEIKRIRSIANGRKRLVEAAKIQHFLFGNIHNDITAWIAGYSSESSIRKEIGTKNLREMFIQNNLKYSGLEYSYADYRKQVRIPSEMTEELAEETGIHIGDGCLSKISYQKWQSYAYRIDGHLTDEKEYHEEFIIPLMQRIYNITGFTQKVPSKSSRELNFKSKVLFNFKNKVLNLPSGKKRNILIPSLIVGRENFERRCLVGIFDTDFTLGQDMNLVGNFASFKLVDQIGNILEANKMKFSISYVENCKRIKITKKSSLEILERWILHNPKHTSKYEIWKRYNTYLPFTSTVERQDLLCGRCSLKELEEKSNKRRWQIKSASRLKAK